MSKLEESAQWASRHLPEDGRLRQVAELLRQQAPSEGGALSCVPREIYKGLLAQREHLVSHALEAVREVLEHDRRFGGCYAATAVEPEESAGVEAAVRAAAGAVECGGDWAALLMLLRERGVVLTETQLSRLVARLAPRAPQCSKQGLQSAVWDTNRRRFPHWRAEGISPDKFRRHWAVAAAAAPFCKIANLQ